MNQRRNPGMRSRTAVSPSYLASAAAFFRPKPATPREGAAGLSVLLGMGGSAIAAAAGAALARRRR